MHEYLENGFRMLFEGKTGKINLVVADKNCARRTSGMVIQYYNSFNPEARVSNLLSKISPLLTQNMETYSSFEDFIATEMTAILPKTPA